MPTNVINVRDLEEEAVKLLESLVEPLRAIRGKAKRGMSGPKDDSFEKSAGSRAGLIDGQELIRNIYADRLISTRPKKA